MDYPGAIEEFEKALDVNPRSAAAHYELGILMGQESEQAGGGDLSLREISRAATAGGQRDIVKQHIMD